MRIVLAWEPVGLAFSRVHGNHAVVLNAPYPLPKSLAVRQNSSADAQSPDGNSHFVNGCAAADLNLCKIGLAPANNFCNLIDSGAGQSAHAND